MCSNVILLLFLYYVVSGLVVLLVCIWLDLFVIVSGVQLLTEIA